MKRSKDEIISMGCNFLLRCIAYITIQPMLISMKWEIKPSVVAKLKQHVSLLSDTAVISGQLFKDIGACSVSCSCCRGQYDRFTVFDHITAVVRGGPSHDWGFYLRPIKPWEANRARLDHNCTYLGSDGCILSYPERPIFCVVGTCLKIMRVMTKEQNILLNDIRRQFHKVQFICIVRLLFGGMRLKKGVSGLDRAMQNKFSDNRKLRSADEISGTN
ncbi:MAG: hypothetical protein CVU51_01280 [Deltaproteobacteria bacterium HGW-Deltaproteobacteria-1]|jgi:hypothetical protein|nr:MAG: hypothetical protein CVU51_01280 [Deltaproteobacteria bacterium HGW-Deltaproteobacteria-1]